MRDHIKVLGILNIIWGLFGALGGIVLFLIFGGAWGIIEIISRHEPIPKFVSSIVAVVGICLSLLPVILAIPSIVAGTALIKFKPWARIFGIVMSILHPPGFPMGTALGVYGLCILVSAKSREMFENKVN